MDGVGRGDGERHVGRWLAGLFVGFVVVEGLSLLVWCEWVLWCEWVCVI